MESTINLSYIQEMVGDDPEMVKEFVSDIVIQIKETEFLMQNFFLQKDFTGISSAAHKLKAILQMIGAEQFYQKIQALEMRAKSAQKSEDILPLYETISALSLDCRNKLEEAVYDVH